MSDNHSVQLSFVIPVKDEEGTIAPLFAGIRDAVMAGEYGEFEVIFIDDGSSDGSWRIMQQQANAHPAHVRALRLRRNFGKSIALATGFQEASGEIICTMDADLQDDPQEIPKLLAKLAEGYDVVSGWKKKRNDPLGKTLPSRLFNAVTARMTGIKLHDFNCGFKAYRREVLDVLKVYGELHRYMPVLAHDAGFLIGEVSVKHNPRRHGKSKYGWERYARGLLDLLTVLATTRWLQKPGHLFGGIGLASGAIGGLTLCYLTVLWFLGLGPIGNRPLLLFGIMLCILSVQMISIGLLAELLIRINNTRNVSQVISAKCGTVRELPISERHSTAEAEWYQNEN